MAALVAGAVKVDGESGSSVGDVGEGDGEKGAGVSGITVYQASGASGIWTPPRFSRVGTEGMSEQQAKPKEHGGKKILDWMRERAGTENQADGCSNYDDEVRAGNTVGQTAVVVASRGATA